MNFFNRDVREYLYLCIFFLNDNAMQILTDYPWYFLFLCLLAGGGYSVLLYGLRRRKASPANDQTPRWARLAMPLLRFVAVSLLAFLLLGPLVKRQIHDKERPILVLAEDNSTSVTDHGYALSDNDLSPVISRLEKDFDVVRLPYGDNRTNISAALMDIHERYAGRNLAAVVLTGDGIYNQGQNPLAVASSLAAPLYTVALGDTSLRPHAAITSVRYNHIAYLGNRFPVEVTVHATQLKGQRNTLTLSQGGKILASQPLEYPDNNYTATFTFTLDADKPGLQTYTLSLAGSRTIAIEVIDGHQKIALLAAAPHPDISAIRQAIEHNPNYALEVFFANQKMPTNLQQYNLLILHNLPSDIAGLQAVNIPAAGLPVIYIIGSRTHLARFNALHSGMEIVARSQKVDDVSAQYNKAFSLFTLDDALCRRLEQLPPLQAPFGDYRTAANLQSLFEATIGGVGTGRPLIAFGQQDGVRRAFVVGEGLWRWRLHNYQMTGSHDDFNTLIEKMVVYTSLQVGKERFRVVSQPVYEAGQPVQIEAELYNDNYEPVNTPDVELSVNDQSYTFNRSGDNYLLHLGAMDPGTYRYTATTTFNGKEYKASGSFAVEEVNLEEVSLVADHALLNTLAATTGGAMLTPDDIDQLPALLAARDDIRSVIYSHTRYTDMMHLPWVLVLLVLLLAAEWALRKYYL